MADIAPAAGLPAAVAQLASTTPPPTLAAPNITEWKKFVAWITSSTTILGNAGVFGTLYAAISGTVTWQHSIPLFVAEAVLIAMPQLSAPTRAEIVADAIQIASTVAATTSIKLP